MILFCTSKFAEGEKCGCSKPAHHKVGEEMFPDDLNPIRHNFTTYLCCACFEALMGPAAKHASID